MPGLEAGAFFFFFFLKTPHSHSSKDINVSDLAADFANGVYLAKLLRVLSKHDIPKIKEPTAARKLQRFEALGNLSACFDFMKRVGVKISNIGPEDVLTGWRKQFLRFFFVCLFECRLFVSQRKRQAYSGVDLDAH